MHVRNIRWTCFGFLLLSFPIACVELWHVLYMLKKCNSPALLSQEMQLNYLEDVSKLLSQKLVYHTENHISFKGEKLMSFYSRTSKESSVFCTVLPQINKIKIDVYSYENTFDRKELKEFTDKSFGALKSTQTTRHFLDDGTESSHHLFK